MIYLIIFLIKLSHEEPVDFPILDEKSTFFDKIRCGRRAGYIPWQAQLPNCGGTLVQGCK